MRWRPLFLRRKRRTFLQQAQVAEERAKQYSGLATAAWDERFKTGGNAAIGLARDSAAATRDALQLYAKADKKVPVASLIWWKLKGLRKRFPRKP